MPVATRLCFAWIPAWPASQPEFYSPQLLFGGLSVLRYFRRPLLQNVQSGQLQQRQGLGPFDAVFHGLLATTWAEKCRGLGALLWSELAGRLR